ncbi:TlpA family protein disulfide reductase [Micromonospora sp. NPDC051300]|uniref:TlpA family protein disulfide reductase n=1 Tax=Micromonospora sp. NPDC051300 TaxID=3364286 RepID=UPI00379632D8
MSALVTVVVVLALVCAFNTALSLALVRRMRYHAELLTDIEHHGVPAQARRPGEAVGHFAGRDADTLVAFFSPTCVRCRKERGTFARVAARWPGGPERVVAVVSGPDATAGFLSDLGDAARVVVDTDEALRHDFGIRGFPALFVVSPDGRLAWTGMHAEAVPGCATP